MSMQPDVATRLVVTRLGLPALFRMAFAVGDLVAFAEMLVSVIRSNPRNTGAAMDLATVLTLLDEQSRADEIQQHALALNRHYALTTNPPDPTVRVLAIVTSGDLTVNTPLDFLLQDPRFALEFLYVLPGETMPDNIPEHDVAVVAIAYSHRNAAILAAIADDFEHWPKPVINRPHHVLKTSRPGIAAALAGIDGVLAPAVVPFSSAQLTEAFADPAAIAFPVIIRPLDSHAGNDLQKIERSDQLAAYLAATQAEQFYVTPFCDYRSSDGMYRKFRVVLIDGKPYIAHMALRDSWMIHYVNAGMALDADKRAAEADAMAAFDDTFAGRHAPAFAEIYARLGLDYLTIDCGEMPDGRLLVFEADTGMLVHDMDPPDIYPYKQKPMRRLFAAYQNAIAARHHGARRAEVA